MTQKNSTFTHGLKSAILAIFQRSADWLDWPCPVNAALNFHSQDFFYILIYFLKYETIVERSARRLVIQIQIQAVWEVTSRFFFQTMSGNETIAYYCLDIFKRAKVTMMNNYTLSILLQTAFTTGYVVSAFIMNHVPRRIQFMSSALFMAVSTATLGFTLNQSVEVCIPWW